jgi:hypothetical protein
VCLNHTKLPPLPTSVLSIAGCRVPHRSSVAKVIEQETAAYPYMSVEKLVNWLDLFRHASSLDD